MKSPSGGLMMFHCEHGFVWIFVVFFGLVGGPFRDLFS